EQSSERTDELATDFVTRRVDIIVAVATPAARAAKKATSTIPIVMNVSDPLATGLVTSLAPPRGEPSGTSITGRDLAGKRLELLREFRHGVTRFAFLGASNDPNTTTFVRATQAAANPIGARLQSVLFPGAEEFEAAFASIVKEQGLIVQPLFVGHRVKLAACAAAWLSFDC